MPLYEVTICEMRHKKMNISADNEEQVEFFIKKEIAVGQTTMIEDVRKAFVINDIKKIREDDFTQQELEAIGKRFDDSQNDDIIWNTNH